MSSDISFTDNLSAVDRVYATHAEVPTDEDGKVPHIDVENSVVEEEGPETPEGDVDPGTDPDGQGEVDPGTDPDDLTEAELEAATAPEGEGTE